MPDLARLALAFPLPWAAYVRLLSVKNPQARAFYETEALRADGACANLTAFKSVRIVAGGLKAWNGEGLYPGDGGD